MKREEAYHINISAPNLVNVCVDGNDGDEISGRIYHCYAEEAQKFTGVVQLLEFMDELFDDIGYPRASTRSRYFVPPERHVKGSLTRVITQKELLRYTGEKGTFITYVQYRQNSEWQGELGWQEKKQTYHFSSTLDFIKLIVNAVGMGSVAES